MNRLSAAAALPLLLMAHTSAAAPCGRPDIDATFPADGAASVPANAVLSAHYGSPATYDDEPVTLLDAQGNGVAIQVSYDEASSLLRAIPDEPLTLGEHQLVWPGLRGVSTAGGLGRGRSLKFAVGSALDATPPSFEGIAAVRWDLARDRDPCLDRLDDRFVFELDLGSASDDSELALLSVAIFQTRDPLSNRAEPAPLGQRPWPRGEPIEVRRPASAAGRTCFAAVVQDLVGNTSGGGEREVCVSTRKPPFFDGCALRAPASEHEPRAFVPCVLVWLWLARWRARHAPSRSCT